MKRLFTLLILALGSFIGILLVGLVTADKTKYNNDFVRIFPPHAADVKAVLEISPNRFHLAGLAGEHVYLWDREGIVEATKDLTDTNRISLQISAGSEIIIDSPYFFLHNGSNAMLYRGHSTDWKVDTTFIDIPGFTAIQPISDRNAVLRRINIRERKNSLTRMSGSQQYVLPRQIDGLLCTDGFLQYSKALNELVYLYRYRNQFVRLDTNLNVVGHGKTIDTISIAKIAVAETDDKITMAAPPLSVNNDACVDRKYLFVHSNLRATNESIDVAKRRSVIDVYRITDGSYLFSFYIENHGSALQEFKVSKLSLIAVFKDAIASYDLAKKYLP